METSKETLIEDKLAGWISLPVVILLLGSISLREIPGFENALCFALILSGLIVFLGVYAVAVSGMIFFPKNEKGKRCEKWQPAETSLPSELAELSFYQPRDKPYPFALYYKRNPESIVDSYAILADEQGLGYTDSLFDEEVGVVAKHYDRGIFDGEVYFYKRYRENNLCLPMLVKLVRDEETQKSAIIPVGQEEKHKGKDSLFIVANRCR